MNYNLMILIQTMYSNDYVVHTKGLGKTQLSRRQAQCLQMHYMMMMMMMIIIIIIIIFIVIIIIISYFIYE